MKKITTFIVCMFLVAIVVNDVSAKNKHHGHDKHPTEAIGGLPVIDSADLMAAFSYPGTVITEVTQRSVPLEVVLTTLSTLSLMVI